ncbi:hypothetical protein BUALT_Bualt19G0081400 [Buddleja alternifolia]|uniref:Mediator complex subunit 15 KIX domain-containing protein n=1 Tax=Buddleja alternifolia TaxID=168488 RepID=A0AAV6W802_9LAMI|nr:hypothetical protein BUALT_Bualt19G0081400 [Buddleja alternifolia]
MDNNNWRAAQGQGQTPGQVVGGEAVAEGGGWRTQLHPDSRHRIVNKITKEGGVRVRRFDVRFGTNILAINIPSAYNYNLSGRLILLPQEYGYTKLDADRMETLKRHLSFSGQEGLAEVKKIAVRFEEKTYAAATSQSDYLRKISLKMFTVEMKSQNPTANSLQSSAASNSENPQDPGKDNPL